MKQAILIIAAVILLAGAVHIAIGLSPLLSGELALDNLWFTSAGLALLLIAFINYLVITAKPWQPRFFAIGEITNVLGSILMGAILLFLPAPHVALLFLLLVAEAVLIIRLHMLAF